MFGVYFIIMDLVMMCFYLFFVLVLVFFVGVFLLLVEVVVQNVCVVCVIVEMSMVLLGSIEVVVDGLVSVLVLDQQVMFVLGIVLFVEGIICGWQFELMLCDGKLVVVYVLLWVCLCGKQQDDGSYQVSMIGVDFSEYDLKVIDLVIWKSMLLLCYFEDVFCSGGQGDVLLLVKVVCDGIVVDVIVEQVNMIVVVLEWILVKMCDLFVKVSISGVCKWIFVLLIIGENSMCDFWIVCVLVNFVLNSDIGSNGNVQLECYGCWCVFIFGLCQVVLWCKLDVVGQVGSDLLFVGGVYMVDGIQCGLCLLILLVQC